SDKLFYSYCCKDSAVTIEINQVLEQQVKGSADEHYKLNVELLNALLYMELNGIRYDTDKAKARREDLQRKLYAEQARLNWITGTGLRCFTTNAIWEAAKEAWGRKDGKGWLASGEANVERLRAILASPCPSLASIGEVEDLLSLSLNVS